MSLGQLPKIALYALKEEEITKKLLSGINLMIPRREDHSINTTLTFDIYQLPPAVAAGHLWTRFTSTAWTHVCRRVYSCGSEARCTGFLHSHTFNNSYPTFDEIKPPKHYPNPLPCQLYLEIWNSIFQHIILLCCARSAHFHWGSYGCQITTVLDLIFFLHILEPTY